MFLLQTVLTCGAVAWLLHRVFVVLNKSLPELIGLLGLEVPLAPDLSVSGILSDSVTLHWTRPLEQAADVRYFIQVNGIRVGETSKLETVITVDGLRPNNFYSVRVIACNASNFHADSRAIHFKTQPWRGQTLSRGVAVSSGYAAPRPATETDASEAVSASKPGLLHVGESASSTLNATIMSREYSAGTTIHTKRTVSGHRSSIGGGTIDSFISGHTNGDLADTGPEGDQSVCQLTEDLEALRREADDIQKLAGKEVDDFETSKAALVRERDGLKQALKEKDDASADLRKEVANLDRQNRSAQNRKAAKERLYQQKRDERTKMQQDMRRWDEEIAEMDSELSQWEDERKGLSADAALRSEEIRLETAEAQKSVKALEEEIKHRGAQVKGLEDARRMLEGTSPDHARPGLQSADEKAEANGQLRLRELQSSFAKAMQGLQQAQENHRVAQERLAKWAALGITHAGDILRLSVADLDLASQNKKGKQRRGRQRKSRTNTLSSSTNGLQAVDPRLTSLSEPSAMVASAAPITPFFNMGNGTAIPPASENTPAGPISQTDLDQLTGGAPMSPTANALLPSNLLGDEDSPESRMDSSAGNMHIGPAFGGNAFTSIGPPGFDTFSHEVNSPASSGSRSASVFSSPRGSLNNLSTYPSAPESLIDSDRRSLNSIGAIGSPHDGGPSSSRRFASLFSLNLNRQRGRTLDSEPPTLGSLKPGQSQSFPVQLEQPPGEELDPIGTKRRRGISSTSWVSPMTNFHFLNRNPAATSDPQSAETVPAATARNPTIRRKPFNMFSSKYDPLEPSKMLGEPSSPRPLSISSLDNALPRPSSDSQPFGWGTAADGGVPHRSSPLSATDWSMRAGTVAGQAWASRGPSRRSSIKHGSTSSLSVGTSVYDLPLPSAEGSLHSSFFPQHAIPPPQPIGTRPASSSSREPVPKLNPAAPTFKTIFSRSDAKKAERAERAAEREKEKELEWLREDASSPPPRLSKDTHSIETTSESVGDQSHESLDHSLSGTPSESTTPSANGTKQSIFQKITRKSSSSKFNLTGWGKDKAGLFSSGKGKGGGESPHTPAEVGEDGADEQPAGARGLESLTSSPNLGAAGAGATGSLGRSSISWSTLMSRKQKKGTPSVDKASSVSEASVSERASETGDDDDDDDAED